MITKSRIEVYKTSDGTEHKSIEAAQKHDLVLLFGPKTEATTPESVADWLIGHREKVIDILTTSAKSKPTARKINGATRKRTPKATVAVAAQAERSAAA